MTVTYDLSCLQDLAAGERGIPKYTLEVAHQLQARHPGLVSRWQLADNQPIPPSVLDLPIRPVRTLHGLAVDAAVVHLTSVFEHVHEALPQREPRLWRSDTKLVVTLYDLIPLIFEEHYLQDPHVRRRYRTRLELVRAADMVLAISQATADDAADKLRIPTERLRVVGTGIDQVFRPPVDRDATARHVAQQVPGLRPEFILYTGGDEFRKNISGLIAGYAKTGPVLRRQHQLVIVCRLSDSSRRHYHAEVKRHGIDPRDVLLTGFVDDNVLLALYQSARLFVFPSLYEGFGLPVAEAMASGTPTIVADNSSLRELVPDADARFETSNSDSLAAAVTKALMAPRVSPRTSSYTWESVGDATAEVYETLLSSPRTHAPRRYAWVTPLPPERTGIATYNQLLLDAFPPNDRIIPLQSSRFVQADESRMSVKQYDRAAQLWQGFDNTVISLGNSAHHVESLRRLRRTAAIVDLHDVRLTYLYDGLRARYPEEVSSTLARELDDYHSQKIPGKPWASKREIELYYKTNGFFVEEVCRLASHIVVHSRYAKDLLLLQAPSLSDDHVSIIPLPVPQHSLKPVKSRAPYVVCSFGIVDPAKQSERVLESFIELVRRREDVIAAFVGQAPEAFDRELRQAIERQRVADRVIMTGHVDNEGYAEWLARADVAVQLRAHSNGETSAANLDALSHGVPLIATDLGSTSELPPQVWRPVPVHVAPESLTTDIDLLLDDADLRASMGRSAHTYARAHSPSVIAKIWGELISGASVG